MVAPLIPIIAGAVARGAATRAGASAAGEAAAQFGGNAIARGAAHRMQTRRENRPGYADDIGRHQWSATAMYGMTQPSLAKSASQQYSQVLQSNQFNW